MPPALAAASAISRNRQPLADLEPAGVRRAGCVEQRGSPSAAGAVRAFRAGRPRGSRPESSDSAAATASIRASPRASRSWSASRRPTVLRRKSSLHDGCRAAYRAVDAAAIWLVVGAVMTLLRWPSIAQRPSPIPTTSCGCSRSATGSAGRAGSMSPNTGSMPRRRADALVAAGRYPDCRGDPARLGRSWGRMAPKRRR